jgi:hypothetical protein
MEKKDTKTQKKPGPPKGVTNNPKGRPKGIPNKLTKESKEILLHIFETLSDVIVSEYLNIDKVKSLPPEVLLEFYIKIIPYLIPKAEAKTEEKSNVSIQFDRLLTSFGVRSELPQ